MRPTNPIRLATTSSLLVQFAALATAQSITLAPRVDFGTAQENAQHAICADFDHDGNLDIAVTMEGNYQGKVEVLFGDGQSDFGSSTEVTSYGAWGLCSGDFDGDGWGDLAATSYGWAQHAVRLWRNDHLGGFTSLGTVSTLASPPVGVISGDLNGDGRVDLAAISETGGYAVDWFAGNGNGTFSAFHYVPNTTGLVGRNLYAGHFDADTHLDLVAIHQTGAMVLLNDSAGTGNFNSSGGITANEVMNSGAVADVDGDGKHDILTAGTNLKVWHGVGNGQFTLLHSYPSSTGALDCKLGDLNGDGRLDVLLVGLGGVQIFFGQTGGAFSAPQSIAAGIYPKAGVIGDWNGDGWNDLAITCQNYAGLSSYTSIYEQVPPTAVAAATAYGTGCGAPVLGFVPNASGLPRLGQVGRATVTSVPSAIVGVTLGWSDQTFGSSTLPYSLAGFGLPGCDLLHSAEAFGLPTAAATATTRTFAFAIPNWPILLGLHLYLQAYAFAPGQNAAEMVTSNGIAWTFGNL